MKVWFKRLALTGLITIVLTPPLLWLADKIWPLPLDEVVMARTVTAEDGSPLWRFADSNGVWRYPVTLKDVSPEFIEALLTYEDRYFYRPRGTAGSDFRTYCLRRQHALHAGRPSARSP